VSPFDVEAIAREAAARAHAEEAWPEPDLSCATADTFPPPALPLGDVFPSPVAAWIARAAEAQGAPADYVAAVLLAVVGGVIGNARWAAPWGEWREPPIVNVALIGAPSSGKSPALDALVQPLQAIEADANADWAERRREHATRKAAAAERRDHWQRDVKAAVEQGSPPPLLRADAEEPEPVQRRRMLSTDPTIEKAGRLAATNPRGLILVRDELAGWIAGMGRYGNGAGADRAFWLQAYGGRPWMPDRVKDGDAEVSVPHLTWAIIGGIQPDRLASALLAGDDDGLAARFVYTWPAPVPPRRPPPGRSLTDVRRWLGRLRSLPWTPPEPVLVPFSDRAQATLQEWREEVARMEAGASGLFLSWIGKLPGFAVRLAVIFAYLTWAAEGASDPPTQVDEADVLRAITILAEYFVPMARRAFGEAALSQAERDSRCLLRWLLDRQPVPTTLNARELRRMADGPGIRNTARLEAALHELAALGCVRQAPPSRAGLSADPATTGSPTLR
jgi:hypothetical protein